MTRALLLQAVIACGMVGGPAAAAAQAAQDFGAAIDRAKAAVVAIGTFSPTRQPQFSFRGSGFAVADGRLVATSAHVIASIPEAAAEGASLAVAVPARRPAERLILKATLLAADREHDLALLRIEGPALPALELGDSDAVRDGQHLLFTGFPIGGALGLVPVTHQAMIAAITPIVLPAENAGRLEAKAIRQIQAGAFDVFQLDAVAYPGSSGSPLFDADARVLGVVSMTVARETRESALPRPTGIAFAVPSRHLQALLRSAK